MKYVGLIAIAGLLITSCARTEDSNAGVASAGLSEPTIMSSDVNLTEEQMATRYVDCLRERGFVLADPTVNYDGTIDWSLVKSSMSENSVYINKNKREISLEQCAIHLVDGVISKENEEEDIVKLQDDLLLLSECMRSKGVDMPDPDFSGDNKSSWKDVFSVSKDSNNQRTQRSLEECIDLVFIGDSNSKSSVK